jgi:hypothetical protein
MRRNNNQIDLINKLRELQPLEVLEYFGPMSYKSVRWNLCNWSMDRKGNPPELIGSFKSFTWNRVLYIIKMKPKQGRLLL